MENFLVKEKGNPLNMKSTDIKQDNKAVSAMRMMSEAAEENGIADMPLEEINQEIQAVRQGK